MPGTTQYKIDKIPHGMLKLGFMARQNVPAHDYSHFIGRVHGLHAVFSVSGASSGGKPANTDFPAGECSWIN